MFVLYSCNQIYYLESITFVFVRKRLNPPTMMSEYLAAAPEPRRVGQNWGLARGCTGHRVALQKNIRSRDPQCGIRTGSQVNPMVKLMTAIGLERVGRNFVVEHIFKDFIRFNILLLILCHSFVQDYPSQNKQGSYWSVFKYHVSVRQVQCRQTQFPAEFLEKVNFVRKTLWEASFCLTTCHLGVNKGPIGTKLALKPVMGAAGEDSILLQNMILQ